MVEKEDIVDALKRLEAWCDDDGWYTKAQIAYEGYKEIERVRQECEEQARLNGMGAERELALLARAEKAEARIAEISPTRAVLHWQARAEKAEAEIHLLRLNWSDDANSYEATIARLREAVSKLYYAAHWTPDRDVDAEKLWTDVRDACGLEPGHAPQARAALSNSGGECIYEARPTYWGHDSNDRPAIMANTQCGAWCRTHGWNCPRVGDQRGTAKDSKQQAIDDFKELLNE